MSNKLSINERLKLKSRKELQALWIRLKMPTSPNKSKTELRIYIRQLLEMPAQWAAIAGNSK